ncbi:MAG TPA: ATP-binding protein, partial [Microbacterium sp.]|nr:ATP-binding protein [Microbacterium sp.]
MTMLDTLFGLIPAASRGQQWLAEDLQLVNWGGYDGAHRVRFSPEATLLCGGSGSGKSTLMDAYIALMMPHTTPFNGASNGGVTGRPRGDEQRNILSYGRGKLDESRTEDGTKMRVLRGDGEDTWTAVAMTWIDHDGSRFTAVRAWYIPAGARVLEDTVRVRATTDRAFDLSSLEQAAALRLSDLSIRNAGLDPVGTDREFSARLHAVLGIGAAGAGAKAMSLLARIQAGQQITTVDDLYKR